jgi:hypothetical protein
MKKYLCFFIILHSALAFAGGKAIGNGGDSRALEFFQSAAQAITEIKNVPNLYPEVTGLDLEKILNNTQILVSEVPVYALKDGINQFSTAINYSDPDTIVLYGPRWSAVKNASIRKSLALHEVLGLANLEKTGEYNISKRYLKNLGITCSQGLCEDLPRYKCNLLKLDSRNITKVVSSGNIGNNGNNEIVDILFQNMKAAIVMNAGVAQGHIMIILYQEHRTVAVIELRGAAFPPFIHLQWKDTVENNKWTVSCQQN